MYTYIFKPPNFLRIRMSPLPTSEESWKAEVIYPESLCSFMMELMFRPRSV